MTCCNDEISTNFLFSMTADIYYPIITQGLYNEIQKEWVYDRTIPFYAMPPATSKQEFIIDNLNKIEEILIARSPEDIRISQLENVDAASNVLIGNICLSNGDIVFKETAGPRANKATFFELSKLEPFVGPFNTIEYYQMIIRRSESQAVKD